MKNFKKYSLVFSILIVIGAILIFRFISPEDTWICKDGKWIKHGNPRAEKPTLGCNGSKDNEGEDARPIIKDTDGKIVTDNFEIILPYGWRKIDNPIPGITVMAINDGEQPQDENTKKVNFRSYFAIVYTTSDKTLNDYLPEYENKIKTTIQNAKITNTNDGTVDGHQAKFLELTTNQQNINLRVFIAIVKGDSNDFWVISLNTTEQLWNKYQTFIPDLLNTFKIKK